uniref:Protein Ycf2 n=1 Tax=Diphyscium foliosum TaxID=82928 RepID=A0A6C0M5Z9_DIPFO|nr:hypothetical chloroplast RF21 [Diphyscium foliosum]QHU77181.1 hypothetical chloroplast RF21 [Diphyscium foliosum]
MKQKLSKNKYLYKRLKLEEIKSPQYFFELWVESNLVKFLIKIFFNQENFIKIFDLRIISSLILRDLHSSKTDKKSILNIFLLLLLSIFLYRLSNKTIIEKKNLNLIKIVQGHINYYDYNDKEKRLEESFNNKKNISIFPHNFFYKLYNLKKKRKKYSIINASLKKKLYLIPAYDQILFWGSEWWKFWIVKEILPSWKISSSSINKINDLLKEKNTKDLKHFFEFYIDNVICQNYDWENKFNSIFGEDSKKKMRLESNKNKLKVLEDTLVLQIFSAFCEKLIFEVDGPLKPKNLNSIIKLNNHNNKSFFSIPISYKKKINPKLSYLLKKKVFQNFKIWGESDKIIAKSYVFIKKKGWFFFNNYAEFYIWQLYKNYFCYYEKKIDQLDIKLNIRFFQLNSLYNKKPKLKIDKNLSNISYQISKYILYKIKNSNKLKSKNYNKSTNNSKIIGQISKLEKKERTKIKKPLNLIETKFFKSNKNIFKSLLYKKNLNFKYDKRLNINSTIWDIFFFIKNEKKEIKSKLFYSPFFKNNLIFWIKFLFIEDEKYITNNFFVKNKEISKSICNSFSNILSIDELNMAFSTTKKYKKKIEVTKPQQQNIFFKYFIKSDNNRLINLWKIKKNYQNLNFFIFLDYAYRLIRERRDDINKSKLNLLANSKIYRNVFYSLFYKYTNIINYNKKTKYNKFLIFQIKEFITLVKILDNLNLLIIKYNLINNKTIDFNINYKINENYKLKKKLLFNRSIYKINKKKKKNLIKNDLKKKFKIYSFFLKYYIEIINRYKLTYKNLYKDLKDSLNTLFLTNNLFSYKKNRNLRNGTKNIVNKNLLDWKKKGKNYFYYNNIKKNIYISWKLDQDKLIDQKKENKKLLNFFVFQQQYLTLLSNKTNFVTNKDSFIKWSNKINKKNIYIFYKTFVFLFSENFNKIYYEISELVAYYPKIRIIQNSVSKKIILNKNILPQQIKFNIYYKLITHLYFEKISITNFLSNYFYNKSNNKICIKYLNNNFFFPIWQNQEILLSSIKMSNKILLNSQVFKADTLNLLNFLYYSDLNYKKKIFFYLKKKKNNNLAYKQLIKSLPIEKKKILSLNQLTFFYKELNKNSNLEVQTYKNFLFKDLEKYNYQKLIFVHNSNLNKLLTSLVKFNPVFYEKKNHSFFDDVSTKNKLIKKQVINFKMTDYYQSILETKDFSDRNKYIQKQLKPNNNLSQTNSFKNYLLSEFFIKIQNENDEMLNWINKLFIRNSNTEKFSIDNFLNKNTHNRKMNYEKNKNIVSIFSKNSIKLITKPKIFKTSSIFIKWAFFEKYILWFFTFEWWQYFQNIVLNSFSEMLLNINDQFNYILPTTLQNIEKKLYNLLRNLSLSLKNEIMGNSFEIWNLRLLKQINNQQKNKESGWPWSYLNLMNKSNKQYLAIISLIIFGYFISQKGFSSLLGSDFFELWGYFETIRYLIDPSRGIYLDNLIHNNSIQFIKSENLLMHFFKNSKHYIKNIKFYIFTKKKINKLLVNNKGLDLSRRERKLLVQSLITDKSINQYQSKFISNTNAINFQIDSQIIKQYKLKNYFESLTENYQKSLGNYPFHKFYLAENLIFLAFWQKAISSQIFLQIDTSKSTFYKKPVPLELRSSSSKGILLIGSQETGRSYLVKNLAADSFVPLIKISINKLLYNKPDIITESWMNILMESLQRLNLILDLAEKLSPCIIWMQNIHELNVNRLTQNVESDPTFLLGIFLKYFQTGFNKKNTNNIVIIGSTHLPKKVDPALISPNRLDRLINIRMFNLLQRQKKISILLQNKHSNYFYSKNKKLCLNEFGHRTTGYNARDLAGLINEISLISITQNQLTIHKNTIRLAFHRQTFGSTYITRKRNLTQNYGILFYKVGKVIIQNIFIKNASRNPLYLGNDLWKKKFYYLSKWYLEPSIFESTIKEFTILPHILGCLAGLAARDSWFILKNKPDNLISLDKYAENDFYLACGPLESLLIDFPWLEIIEEKNIDKKRNLKFQFQTKNPLHMIKKGLFSIINENKKNKLLNKSFNQTIPYKKELYQLTSNITWAPKISRLSFIRTNLFNWINRPNEFDVTYNFGLFRRNEKRSFNGSLENSQLFEIIQHKTKEQLPYERILSRIRRRNVQELESQLEDILLEEQFVILGFSRLFTEYQMESQLSNKPMIFIGGRFLWDPTGLLSQSRHFIFSRQNLFIDEEMLRRLYVTYGARREREKSRSSQKIKQFFLRRGYGRDSINDLSINWWNKLPFIEKNNIETFKRIEGIGVQLKRPQVFTPVYLYQRWLIENPRENITRFELLDNQKRWLKANSLLLNDSFIYNILLEIYQYLLNFFILHRILLDEMTETLLKNKWLFQNEIEHFINIIK